MSNDLDAARKRLDDSDSARNEIERLDAVRDAVGLLAHHIRSHPAPPPSPSEENASSGGTKCSRCKGSGQRYAKMFGGMRPCRACDGTGEAPKSSPAEPEGLEQPEPEVVAVSYAGEKPDVSGPPIEGRWRCTCCKAEADADQVPMLGAWRVLFGTEPFRIICLQHNCPTNHPQCGWFDAERIDDERTQTTATTVVHRTGCPLSPCDCGATADVGEPAHTVDRAPGVHDAGHVATTREAEEVTEQEVAELFAAYFTRTAQTPRERQALLFGYRKGQAGKKHQASADEATIAAWRPVNDKSHPGRCLVYVPDTGIHGGREWVRDGDRFVPFTGIRLVPSFVCAGCRRRCSGWEPRPLGARGQPTPILDRCAECQPAGSPHRREPPKESPSGDGGGKETLCPK